MTTMKRRILALGSLSEHKGVALNNAVARLLGDPSRLDLRKTDVSSGLPQQPMGLSAITLGAVLRARRAAEAFRHELNEFGTFVWGIGVESGLERALNTWLDIAVVAITFGHGEVVALSTSVGMPFPDRVVEGALQAPGGLSLTTAGSVLAAAHGQGDGTDPHAVLTDGRLRRQALLTDAFYAALVQVPGLC